MKSFIWFTTVLLLCLELVHAAHITPLHVYRQHRRASALPVKKSVARRILKKRGGGSCKPSSNVTIPANVPKPMNNNTSSSNSPYYNPSSSNGPHNNTGSPKSPCNTTSPYNTPSNTTSPPNSPYNNTSPPNSPYNNTNPPNTPSNNTIPSNNSTNTPPTTSSGGFPSLGFQMPSSVPSSLDGWWSDYTSDIGFLGFSYSVAGCQDPATLKSEFQNIRTQFNGRYVRLYGACDQDGFYDTIVDAAWDAGLGVHALIWFGFDGDDMWMTRRDSLFSSLHNNPKAKFVTRAVQFGSEPLFDQVLPPDQLASQVLAAKQNLADLGILVTVSDMAYGYQSNGGAQDVLDAVDFIDLHMLPFFSTTATTASDSWGFVQSNLDWINSNAGGKKIILSENGWPSMASGSTRSSSPTAVADVQQEQDYFDLLDSKCEDLKGNPGGGVAWFAHLYSEDQGAGYGVLENGQLKFPFNPKTSC